MLITRHTIKTYAWSILFLFLAQTAFAGDVHKEVYARGSEIAQNIQLDVEDDKYAFMLANPSWMNTFGYPTSNGVVKLKYTGQAEAIHTEDWTIKVVYSVRVYGPTTNGVSSYQLFTNQEVELSYNGTGVVQDVAIQQYPNAHKLVVDVKRVEQSHNWNVLSNDIFFEVGLQQTRYQYLDVNSNVTCWHNYEGSTREIKLGWGFLEAAESYDVEWYFWQGENAGTDPAGPSDIPAEQYSRVNVKGNRYALNDVYDTGILYYRVRPVGKGGQNFEYRVTGQWSSAVSNKIYVGNTQEDMNWSYTANYAEDGKRAEVLTYVDGLGRSKQQVAKNNSDKRSIVAETLYDYEGNPVVQTLPIPVDRSEQQQLNYYPGYTQSTLSPGVGYVPKKEYAKNSSTCDQPDFWIAGTGAGQYYSPNNTEKTGINAYIPDLTVGNGKSYAFTHSVMGPDGTVLAQSGIGPDLKLSGDHQTEFYHYTPPAEKLLRLFGNEVGNAAHYRIDAVKDPNGQVSLSYKNLSGQVIATSLVGDGPTGMRGLDNAQVGSFTSSYNDQNKYRVEEDAIVIESKFFAEVDGGYNFQYNLNGAMFSAACGSLTGDCVYDYSIVLTDDCGRVVGQQEHAFTSKTSDQFGFLVPLTVGMYHIEKRLTLNQAAFDAAVEAFKEAMNEQSFVVECLPFSVEQMANNLRPTYLDCDCETAVYEGGSGGGTPMPAPTDLECTPDGFPTCEALITMMETDMSPGGQYFDNHPNPGNPNGWLNLHLGSVGGYPFLAGYTDWDDVRENWDESLAYEMGRLHPEFCHYNWCRRTQSSMQFDFSILDMSAADAEDAGLFVNGEIDMIGSAEGKDDLQVISDDIALNLCAGFNIFGHMTAINDDINARTNGLTFENDEEIWAFLRGQYIWEKRKYIENAKSLDQSSCQCRYLNNNLPNNLMLNGDMTELYNNSQLTQADVASAGFDVLVKNQFDQVVALLGIYDGTDGSNNKFNNECKNQTYELEINLDDFQYHNGADFVHYALKISGETVIAFPDQNNPTGASYKEDIENIVYLYEERNAFADEYLIPAINNHDGEDFSIVATRMGNAIHLTCTGPVCNALKLKFLCKTYTSSTPWSANDNVRNGDFERNTCNEFFFPACDKAPWDNTRCLCDQLENLNAYYNDIKDDPDLLNGQELNVFIAGYLNDYFADKLEENQAISPIKVGKWLASGRCDIPDVDETRINLNLTRMPNTDYLNFGELDELCESPWDLDPCKDNPESEALVDYYANKLFEEAKAELLAEFITGYREKCLGEAVEDFRVGGQDKEYQITLYYYGQAGNLLRTVPPKGVDKLDAGEIAAAKLHQKDDPMNPTHPIVLPDHTFVTEYQYNTLNQLVRQWTPDQGKDVNDQNVHEPTQFWYNRLGQLVASQNPKQKNYTRPSYSYSKYDGQARVIEAGEVELVSFDPIFFPLVINDVTADQSTVFPDNAALPSGKREVIRTFYEKVPGEFQTDLQTEGFEQTYLRSRVSASAFYSSGTSSSALYATHYSYDIHGNVDKLLQENALLKDLNQGYKQVHYNYDLVSGNVNQVTYQPGEADQFMHRYRYDADNRITHVETSRNGLCWDEDARYFYYAHGPLARTEIGDQKVHGMDYQYNGMGWLKGVNANVIGSIADAGKDGYKDPGNIETGLYDPTTPRHIHENFPTDAYGFSLGYFDGDYKAIGEKGDAFLTDLNTLGNKGANLYNGNIRHMATALMDENNSALPLHASVYEYDQLNRLAKMDVHTSTSSYQQATEDGLYHTDYTYDENGNILTLVRNGYEDAAQSLTKPMDNMTYTYIPGTNQLDHVDDGVPTSTYNDDIEDQAAGNYAYDKIGNLIKDDAEGIANIEWFVNGKVRAVTRTQPTNKPDLEFGYDALGNRIYKLVKPAGQNQTTWTYTFYVRDAQGNVMATYKKNYEDITDPTYNVKEQLTLTELPIYGSSRLGLKNEGELLASRDLDVQDYLQDGSIGFINAVSSTEMSTLSEANGLERNLGTKSYELSNHLGNVLSVISDRKYLEETTNTPNSVYTSSFEGGDERLFGNIAYTNKQSATYANTGANSIQLSYNTEQFGPAMRIKVQPGDEIVGTSIMGRVQHITGENGGVLKRCYADGQDNILYFDDQGTNGTHETKPVLGIPNAWQTISHTAWTVPTQLYYQNGDPADMDDIYYRTFAWIPNATTPTTWFDDMEVEVNWSTKTQYVADIQSYNDYYPGGSTMPGRSYSGANYRYGFNGKEKDDEFKGSGNSYDFGARMYDSRIMRWLALDPAAKEYPDLSDYVFVGNTPIQAIDPDGKRIFFVAGAGNDSEGWNYVDRFKQIFTELGIDDFIRINASHGKLWDISFVDLWRHNDVIGVPRAGVVKAKDDAYVLSAVNDIVKSVTETPLSEGEQLNLAGYSYGSVLQAQAALVLIEKGYKIDNLVLIGSPISDDSELYRKLLKAQKEGKIGNVIRHDIEGDKLSNPESEAEFVAGGIQNSGDDGPHFDLARPDNPETPDVDEGAEADQKIKELGEKLIDKGIK